MPNTQEVGYAVKQRMLGAVVNGVTVKAALYLASATTNGSTTDYTTTGEVTGTNYPAGGVTVANANTAGLTGATAFWTPSANAVFTNVTLTTAFDAVMFYDTSNTDNLGVFTFGSQTITAGTFTLTMPANNSSTALIRLS